MYATIQKWGNSQGIRVPKTLLDALGIRENDRVELVHTEEGITIRKPEHMRHKTLEERLTAFYNAPINKIALVENHEIDWGKPEGDEVW